eukprot:5074575-Prymnesium_polylepis.1
MLPTSAKWTPSVRLGVESGVGTGSAVPMLTRAESTGVRRRDDERVCERDAHAVRADAVKVHTAREAVHAVTAEVHIQRVDRRSQLVKVHAAGGRGRVTAEPSERQRQARQPDRLRNVCRRLVEPAQCVAHELGLGAACGRCVALEERLEAGWRAALLVDVCREREVEQQLRRARGAVVAAPHPHERRVGAQRRQLKVGLVQVLRCERWPDARDAGDVLPHERLEVVVALPPPSRGHPAQPAASAKKAAI